MTFRMPTDEEIMAQIPAARARGRAERRAGRRATSARYDEAADRIVVEQTNGFAFAFPVRKVQGIRHLTPEQLHGVEVFPGGSGIHWPALDLDLDVPGLLAMAVGREVRNRHFASVGGRSKSPAKVAAARENGAKGGRPRKARRA